MHTQSHIDYPDHNHPIQSFLTNLVKPITSITYGWSTDQPRLITGLKTRTHVRAGAYNPMDSYAHRAHRWHTLDWDYNRKLPD